ncbi:MAG TPA: hypothetical protein VIK26_03995 [Clostridium sp.]
MISIIFLCAAGFLAAFVVFAIEGKVWFLQGIFVAVFMILGAHFGTKTALTKGSKLIRPIFIVMSFGVLVKLVITL